MTLIFATGNQKKLEQARQFLAPEIQLIWKSVDLLEPQTTSLREIASAKIMEAYDLVQSPVMIDDTAVYIDGYNDFPGTFAKFSFDQIGVNGFQKLAKKWTRWSLQCLISYMWPELSEPLFFLGIVHGRWDFSQKLDEKYRQVMYDCFFYPDATNPGEMTTRVIDDFEGWKMDYSHRANATIQLKKYLLNL